ncbi:MAG: aldehyde dehydrogenase [Chitinophagaceae bacterium]|nr:aldehyde dehydrogenase [Chitinophagaceae bacterium]
MTDLNSSLVNLRSYYNSHATRSHTFRKKQLQTLKQTLLANQKEIEQALYADLKKNPEETYATETGLVLAEINVALKNLGKWMTPESVGTNLVNFPSSSKIYRDPLGVVLIIAPWNYPLQLLLMPLVGAIAGGNCVVLKPSEFSPATSALVKKLIQEIFPPEYIIAVTGDGAEVVPAMMRNFRFDYVFYTGSIPVGKSIYQMAAEKLVPVTLELGGKSPAIVTAEADITIAAKRIAFGKFLNTGQTCIAPDYVLVHNTVKEKFINNLKEKIIQFYSDDAANNYNYGKIINEKRFDKLISYLSDGNIVTGGEHNREKLFIAPTVLKDVSADASIMQEEIFGPILPVIGYNNTEEAMEILQRNPTPLAFYLFTGDKSPEKEWIDKISFGGGCINNADWHFTNHHLPFGGVGSSGIGAYHGKFTFDTFTRAKPVMKTPTWFDPAFKYPPLKGKLKLFKWFIK